MATLLARNLEVTYPGGVVALRSVDLQADAGETLAIVGESGSGKSTLLKCFNRLVEPSAGEVEFDGQPVSALEPTALRRRLGYVQQEGGLLPHWSVRRNVELVPWLLGWEAGRRRERADELLALLGLEPAEFGERRPSALSGGQRQRVAFARALAADPAVLLLDEAFGALDPVLRLELQDEVVRLQARLKKTLLLVTHDLREALRLGDRVAVLREGELLQVATPEVLQAEPAHPYVEALLRTLELGS